MMAEERKAIRADLNLADVSSLHPPDDENALIHKLISQYLAHEGYVETSRAFAADVRERQSISNISQPTALGAGEDDDIHAIHRQKIRKAILDGDIDKALKYTHSYYPLVFQDDRNKDIYFALRCRKFIEMMRRYSDLSTSTSEDTQMELDDQLNREAPDDVDMETSTSSLPKSAGMKAGDYLTAALQYGQELQAEFGGDTREEIKKQLSDVFAIMAYVDPRESVVGGLLDAKGRVGIAEGVNGAILGEFLCCCLSRTCAD